MMKPKTFISISFLLLTSTLTAQYKNDNVLYKTVYLEDLCEQLKANPGYIFLDVRSKGEHNDSSSFAGLNIGHLKNAINIDIRELPYRLKELQPLKEKTIFIYCSHSQRSRRAGKLLADSGFSKLININGGLTGFHLMENRISNCSGEIFETKLPYQILTPEALCRKEGNERLFLVDIRSDSTFRRISANEKQNAVGNLRTAINIPFGLLSSSLDKIPADKEIIIVDENGNESPKAAQLLLDKGFKNVGILFNGMEMWGSADQEQLSCKNQLLINRPNYSLITANEFYRMVTSDPQLSIIDVRKEEEYSNKSKDNWKNIGNIQNAMNIPFETIPSRLTDIEKLKNKPVVLYGFSSLPEVFAAAKMLSDKGFTKITVLMGGIFNLRWTAANIKGKSNLKELVVNIPPDNL